VLGEERSITEERVADAIELGNHRPHATRRLYRPCPMKEKPAR
jgi:hypothetical protein